MAHSFGTSTPARAAARITRRALGDGDRSAVDRQLDRRRARVASRGRSGAGVPRSVSSEDASSTVSPPSRRSKSSAKCTSALRTGNGVRPPIAHSDPSAITSHRSSSRSRRLSSTVGAGDDLVDQLDAPGRADAARRALAARLDRAELHREAGLRGHVDGVVEHHDRRRGRRARRRRRTSRSPSPGRSGRRQVAPSGPPTCTARTGRPALGAAAEVVDEFVEGDAERRSRRCRRGRCCRRAGTPACPGCGRCRAPRTRPRRRRGWPARSPGVSTLLTTVGSPNRPDDRRQRRLGPDHAAAALEALEHRRLFAADVGAGADPHVEPEGEPAAQTRRRRASRARRRSRSPHATARSPSGYSLRM